MTSFLPELKTRTRTYGTRWTYTTIPFVGSTSKTTKVVPSTTTETILSQCHTGSWPTPRGSTKDIGGLMDLTRSSVKRTRAPLIHAPLIDGHMVIVDTSLFHATGIESAALGSNSEINTFGTSAIARCIPTNPNSSLSTALGELKKDGLPSIPGSGMRDQVNLARRSGNEFLNIEFGWLPLISDIRKFADSVKRSRILIDQYRRDSDRKIRRRFTPEFETHEVEVYSGVGRGPGNSLFPGCVLTKTKTTRFWFSGAFRYHVPVGDDFYDRLRRYEQYSHLLFDTRLTPELLWNLAPWSWAVDWFTNAGDVIHNISALGSDGLVLQYGYAMREARIHELARGDFDFTSGGKRYTGSSDLIVETQAKQRRPAHPYGFGITDASLNKTQWAILAALGLTRGQRNGN